ncbi:ABC transporter permease [Sphaerisporangium rufum]|uniref:ABC transporter permease n=1 Tax=Sphaerisporangium rufum TaxID=1381558 RepID=A0A919R1T9_9ACTN|nr:ABC transporter permease [Sphaerisporangium rufum]GII78122.1 ABC transporter permease [Sphaerisporangium rufum]
MLGLAVSGVRHRMAAFTAVFVSALLGAALIVLSGALFETGIRLDAPPERLAAAPLIVTGDASYRMLDAERRPTTDLRPYPERHRLAADAPARLASVGGVRATVPVLFFPAAVRRQDGTAATVPAQNWASAALGPFAPVGGAAPAAPDEIALTPGLARALAATPGATVRLTVRGEVTDYRVTATAGDRLSPDTVFLSEARARALGGPLPLDAVGVLPRAGTTPGDLAGRLEAAIPGITALTGDGRGGAEYPGISAARVPTIVIGAVFGGIVAVVLATVVSATVGLSVRQRAREISLLRAAGATGRQVRRLVVTETMLVGGAGAVLGLAAGVPAAHLLFAIVTGSGVVPPALRLALGPVPFAVALAVTLLVLWAAARGAARPVRRSRAIDAMRDADLPRHRVGAVRLTLGVLFGLGGIALAVITCLMSPSVVSATSGPAVLAGSICVALLAPVMLRLGLLVFGPLARLAGGRLGALGAGNVRARTGQLATVSSCVALVVGIGGGNLVAQSITLAAQREASIATVGADLTVQVPGGVDRRLAETVAATPGVRAASAFVLTGGWIEQPYDGSHRDRPWQVRGVTAAGAAGVLTNRVTAGSLADLTGDTVALPAATARDLGVAVGRTLRFRFGDGAAGDLRLVATFDDREGYETLLLPAELAAAHTTGRTVRQLAVRADPGLPAGTLEARLAKAVADRPGATVGGREGVEAAVQQGLGVQALVNALLVAVTVAYAAIAVVNTVSVSVLSRRRELALLRLAGATRRRVRSILLTEMSIVMAAGAGAGLIVAGGAIVPTAIAVSATPLTGTSLAILLGLVAVVVALVVPVTALVARRAMSDRPAETLAGPA